MYLIFDTETTGLPKRWGAPISDTDNWPRCIQIAWQLHDDMGKVIEHQDYLVKPEGFNIPYDAERIHGISTELAEAEGILLAEVLEKFNIALSKAEFIVGQNLSFDVNIMGCEFYRAGIESPMGEMKMLDTCTEVTASLLKLPGGRGGKFKLPTLTELHQFLFNTPFAEAHNATADVEATTRCFFELIRTEVFTKKELEVEQEYFQNFKDKNPREIQLIGLQHINLKEASEARKSSFKQDKISNRLRKTESLEYEEFEKLIRRVFDTFLSKKSKNIVSGIVFISGFKLVSDHNGNTLMMMQLVQLRELEKKENSDLIRLLFLADEDYKGGRQKRAIKVWIKITIRGFERVFGNVEGQLDIVEIFNKLQKEPKIIACFCKVNKIFVNGKTEIPTLSINQFSNRDDYPIEILNAIARINDKLSRSDYDMRNFLVSVPFELFLEDALRKEWILDTLDITILKQSVMKTRYYNEIRNSKKELVIEQISLTYGESTDVIIEDKDFYDPNLDFSGIDYLL